MNFVCTFGFVGLLDQLGVSAEDLAAKEPGASVTVGEIKYTVSMVLLKGEFRLRAEGADER